MGAYSIVGPSGLPLSPIPTSIMESSSGGGVDLPAPSDGNGSGADAQPVLKKPRRNPALSCQLCRTKKIKCDRNRPCANCVTRGAECRPQDGEPLFPLNYAPCPEPSLKRPYEPYDAADGSSATRSPSSGPRHSSGSSARGTHSPTQGFSLQVNETSWMRSPELPSSGISMLSLVASHQAEMRDQDSLKTANLLEEIAMGMRDENGRTHDEPLPPEVALRQKRLADIRDLEQTRQSGRIELFSGADFFKMTDEQGFQSTSSANSGSHGPSSMHSSIELITAQLPPEAHASIIAANYFDLVHPLFHILHRPTVETSIGEVYSRADRVYTSRRRAAGLALIYAVLAVGAHFWPSSRKDAASGLSHEDLREPCRRWRTLSIDALSLGRFLGAPSLEALQTLCTLPLVLNNVGESETFRNLFGAVIRMAHTLGLHRMGVERKPSEDRVTWETKRRVWHYIASSDWLESCHGGPRQGIAMVNPKLMDTSFPSNCSDEDICAGRGEGNGLDVPTPMSFSFFRYQLAQVCYDAVELLGLNVYLGDGNQADYEKILLVDRRYHDLLRNFPTHYRNDTKARSDSAGVIAQQPYIAWQRIMLHLGCHSMLIRLHRPFLISGAHEPRVAYSRMICLRSAHQVLRLCHQSLQDGFTHSLRLWTCIHHYFMAAVILSIDFYCNYDEFSADETRKEVLAACAVLESARKESTIAEQGLRVLHTILRRWKDSQNLDAAAAAQHAEDTAVATTAPAAAELDSAANTTTEATAAAGGRQLSMTLSQQQQDEDELDDFMIPPTVGVGEVPLYSELTGLGASEETANMDWTGLLGNLDGISDQWWEQLGGGFMS